MSRLQKIIEAVGLLRSQEVEDGTRILKEALAGNSAKQARRYRIQGIGAFESLYKGLSVKQGERLHIET